MERGRGAQVTSGVSVPRFPHLQNREANGGAHRIQVRGCEILQGGAQQGPAFTKGGMEGGPLLGESLPGS